MRSKSKVSCNCVLLPWWMTWALLLLVLDGTSAAPIPQSASELIADDGKTLAVGPGKSEDNAVFVVYDSNKLSFTLFRPSCLGLMKGPKEINSQIRIENSCEMNITWGRSSFDEETFRIVGGDKSITVPRSLTAAQVDLDRNSVKYGFPGVDKGNALPCMLDLRKVPDGNGYLANISFLGTPECEVKALFKYKQYIPMAPENSQSLASDSLSTPAIIGIICGVVGVIAVLGLICLLLYCCLLKKGKKDQKEGSEKLQRVVSKKEEPKQKQPVGGTCQPGQKKPSNSTQPVPPKETEKAKKKPAESVAIVVEHPIEEVKKPKSQPKQVIKPSVSEEVPKSPPIPTGVPVGYRPEDCVRAVSLEKSLSPNTETKKEIAKVQEEFEKHPEWRSSWRWIEGRDGRDHMYWTRLSDQYVPRRQIIGMNSIGGDHRNMTPEQKKLEKVRVAKFIAKQKLCGFGDPSTDDDEKVEQQQPLQTDKTQQSEQQSKKKLNREQSAIRRKKKRDKRDAAVDESEAKQ